MHIQKLNLHGSKMIIAHDLRTHNNYSNDDIDLTRTENNTIYCNRGIDYLTTRSSEIYIYGQNGKHKNDINYTCSVVVQYPKNCAISEEQFFDAINDYFNFRFGEKNCICSVVHRDESEHGQAHLHYVFMPVVKMDKAKNGHTEKLCAKEVVNREMLLNFHSETEKALKELTLTDVYLTTEEHRQYVNDIDEYKQLQDELKSTKKELQEVRTDYDNAVNMYNELANGYNELAERFNYLQEMFDKLRNYFNKHRNAMLSIEETEMQKELHQIDNEINQIR